MQPVHGSEALISLEKLQGYEERCRVRPGLTGLAQIYADRDIPRLINIGDGLSAMTTRCAPTDPRGMRAGGKNGHGYQAV
jgi:hypothetical protein